MRLRLDCYMENIDNIPHADLAGNGASCGYSLDKSQ